MRNINTFLPFWEGFSVVTIKPDGDALQIDLTPNTTRFPSCGGCQKTCSTTHEYCERTVRDLPILGRAVRLCVLLRRVGCRNCGKRMESVSWLDRYARMTRRLAEAVENQIRPWALGRSNWLFAGSLRSRKRAAAIMSLIQSARMNGHDPYAYLKDVLTRLPAQRASEITELLPHKWAPV